MTALSKYCIALPRPVEERDSPFILSNLMLIVIWMLAQGRTTRSLCACQSPLSTGGTRIIVRLKHDMDMDAN